MTNVIRFAGYRDERSAHTRASRVLAAALERYSGGTATLDFVPDITARGHRAADLIAMTEAGELDGCYVPIGALADRVPELALFDQLFLVSDRRKALSVLDGVIGDRLKRKVADRTDLALTAYWDDGWHHISATRALHTPADCAGLSLATLENADRARAFAALGFDPRPVDARDIGAAVTSGEVDAREGPLCDITDFALYRSHRHVTLTAHIFGVVAVFANEAVLRHCGEKLRVALQAALGEATAAQRRMAPETEESCRAMLAAEGVEITTIDAAERAAFAAAVAPAVAATRTRFDEDLRKIFAPHRLAPAAAPVP